MSRRYPVCSAREVVKVLRKHGFAMVSQSGSHQKWRHENGRQVIVAMHGSKTIPIGTLKSATRNLTTDNWLVFSPRRMTTPPNELSNELAP